MHSWWLSGLAFHSEWNIIQSFSLCICCYFIIFFHFFVVLFCLAESSESPSETWSIPCSVLGNLDPNRRFIHQPIRVELSSSAPLFNHRPHHGIWHGWKGGREGGRDGAWNLCAPFIPPEGHRITKKTQTDRKIEETETEFNWLLFNGEFQFSW